MAEYYDRPGMFDRVGQHVGGMFGGIRDWSQPKSNRLMLTGMGLLSGKNSSEGWEGAMKGLVAGSALDTERRRERSIRNAIAEGGTFSDLTPQEQAVLGENPELYGEALVARLKPRDPLDQYTFTEVDGVLMRVNKYDGTSTPVYGTAGGGPGGQKAFDREKALRGEASGDPQFKRFQEAVPVYQSMVETGGTNSKFSDLNLVYGLAKIMDPTSVVREGEQILVRDASGLSENIVGQINALNGGQALTPATRQALMREAKSRMVEYRKAAAQQQGFYGGIADEYGIDRGKVIPGLQELGEFEASDDGFTAVPIE